MPVERRFTGIFKRAGDWWIAWVEELPGANTQGTTLEDARKNLKGAMLLILEAHRALAEEEIAGEEVIKEELVVEVA